MCKERKFTYATLKGDELHFDDGDAAEVSIYESLRDLSNGYFRGGEKEPYDTFDFTPEFGECKGIENIEVLIKEYALKNNIKECYYYIEWMSQCSYMIDPETLELGDILEFSGQYGDYGVGKNGEMEGVELEELDE